MSARICIIGLDALGQSLALALNHRSDIAVVAYDRSAELMRSLEKAPPCKLEWTFAAAVEGAHVIILNEPLQHAPETLGLIKRDVTNEAVIADTSPYLATQAEWAQQILPAHLFYVGATPLVSVTSPQADAFQGQRIALVPLPNTPENALRLVSETIAALGAEPLYMELAEHDSMLAAIYQLPIVASGLLMRVAANSASWRELSQMAHAPFYAATTFPMEDPIALAALLHSGREPLRRWLEAYERELATFRELLYAEDTEGLKHFMESSVEMGKRWRMKTDPDSVDKALDDVRRDATAGAGIRRLFGFGSTKK